MTWPTTEAKSLTLRVLRSTLRIRLILFFSLEILRSVTETAFTCQQVSNTVPSQIITCTGSQRDFSSLIRKPYLVKSARTIKLLILALMVLTPPPKPSSRKIAMGIP